MALSEDLVYCTFDGKGQALLTELARNLLSRQQLAWPQLQTAYVALAGLRVRRVQVADRVILLQYNPPRIKSTGAAIDPAAIKARPCFLCPPNLPPVQQAIHYYHHWLVLCNPFPIFSPHFTIAHVQHLPQSLSGVWPSLLQLARDFSPDFALLYNGPQCGASAPDHLHFQAVPPKAIPALNSGREGMKLVWQGESLALLRTTTDPLAAFLLEGAREQELVAFLARLIKAIKSILSGDGEPRLNLFVLYEEGRWRIMIFPRRRHRPAAYYKAGEEQILLSPGAVDMGGLLVIPREEDFNRLDSTILRKIFQEISVSEELLNKIAAAL